MVNHRIKGFLKKFLYAIYLLAVTLFCLEIGVRFWGYSEKYIYDPIFMPFNKTEDIPFVHKPNLKNAQARGLVQLNTDSLGLRSITDGARYGPKKKNEYRIAITGDSVTFGNGITNTKDTFCQVLENNLNNIQNTLKVKVFNYGVGAYSVKEMAATLRHRMLDVEPDLVLMCVIPDDFKTSRVPTIDKWGYTSNYNKSGFVPVNSYLKKKLRKMHLTYLLRDIRYQLLKGNQNSSVKDKLPESYKYVLNFKEISEELNLPYNIILLPYYKYDKRKHFVNFKILSKQLNQNKIHFIDLSFLNNEFTPEQYKASKFNRHPSPIVHRRIGEVLTEYILQEHLH